MCEGRKCVRERGWGSCRGVGIGMSRVFDRTDGRLKGGGRSTAVVRLRYSSVREVTGLLQPPLGCGSGCPFVKEDARSVWRWRGRGCVVRAGTRR